MIQAQFVEKLKSDLYYEYVGTEGTIQLFIFENVGDCLRLRTEYLHGIFAYSQWTVDLIQKSAGTVDLAEYLSSIVPSYSGLDVDIYLKKDYLVLVFKP